MLTYQIKDWAKIYENNRTRGMKSMAWVPVPNRMDGFGYTELVDHPDGAAHFGAWIAMLEIASRAEVRGTFPQEGAEIPQALARISRLPAELFAAVIPRLIKIGWLEEKVSTFQADSEIPHPPAEIPHPPAEIPHPTAEIRHPTDQERKERKEGKEGKEAQAPACAGLPLSEFFEERFRAHPNKRGRGLAERCLAEITGIETLEVQEAFRKGHDRWIATDEYQWKGGAKCPTLAEFIVDQTWRYLPAATIAEEDPYQGIDISNEERARQEAAATAELRARRQKAKQ